MSAIDNTRIAATHAALDALGYFQMNDPDDDDLSRRVVCAFHAAASVIDSCEERLDFDAHDVVGVAFYGYITGVDVNDLYPGSAASVAMLNFARGLSSIWKMAAALEMIDDYSAENGAALHLTRIIGASSPAATACTSLTPANSGAA